MTRQPQRRYSVDDDFAVEAGSPIRHEYFNHPRRRRIRPPPGAITVNPPASSSPCSRRNALTIVAFRSGLRPASPRRTTPLETRRWR